MSSAVNITVVLNGGNKTFCCYTDKTVGWAEDKIRSKYGLQFGGITLGGVDQDSGVKFEGMKDGELQFVDGERLAQAGGGGLGQGSPRLMDSVFVLCDVNSTPVGTAFVISPYYVISAYHCVADDPNKPTKKHANEWLIMNGLERNSVGVVSPLSLNSVKQVEVVKFVIKDDWVLLRRKDGLQFSPDVVVPVCQEGSIPNHEDEVKLKIYHCPIDLFRDGMSDVVRPCSVEHRLGMITNHRAFVQTGLFGGSSGGLYALMNGEALAMHIESVSTSHSVSDFASDLSFDEKQCVSEASDSCANTYAAFVSGIILCRYKNLMQFLQP